MVVFQIGQELEEGFIDVQNRYIAAETLEQQLVLA
jgi:hypothetical protein